MRALEIRLRKRYATRGSVSFELHAELEAPPGFTVVLGHSGAGKTTLLRCIAGLCDPEEGAIIAGGRVLFDAARGIRTDPAKRNVAYVFQDLALFPHLTVQENIAYGLRLLDAKTRQSKTDAILESFQIAHLRKRLPRRISGGEQQRVALARALVKEPCVLLLDEPLSSLDGRTKEAIAGDLRAWNEAHRIPILYVTHNHGEITSMGGRVVVMDHGRVVPSRLPVTTSELENIFEATVMELRGEDGMMVCRLAGSAIEMQMPQAEVRVGARFRLGIRARDILLASARPDMLNGGAVLRGAVTEIDRVSRWLRVRAVSGPEFRMCLSAAASRDLAVSSEVWLVIAPRACRVIGPVAKRLLVFVCAGNTSRSPMAQAICRAEVASRLDISVESLEEAGIQVVSAGISAKPGQAMTAAAHRALEELGVPGFEHRSQNLTAALAAEAAAIFCMTAEQRDRAARMFPDAAGKIHCLRPDADFEDPAGSGVESFLTLGSQLREVISQRMDVMLGPGIAAAAAAE